MKIKQIKLDNLIKDLVIDFKVNNEAKEYHGCSYEFNNNLIIQRTAKITPTKIGQFVTLWKRDVDGITCPVSTKDSFDFVVIFCKKKNLVGRFLFPKYILEDKGYLSSDISYGKRGFRVYPDWDLPKAKQAVITQKWQRDYFKRSETLSESDFLKANSGAVENYRK
jgi:hypothetical protein